MLNTNKLFIIKLDHKKMGEKIYIVLYIMYNE